MIEWLLDDKFLAEHKHVSASYVLRLLFWKALNTTLFRARIDTFLILVGTGALPHNYHLVLQLNVQTVYQQLYTTQ